MARNVGRLGARSAVAATANITFISMTGSATVDTVVRDISISYDGIVVTNTPNDVQVVLATSAGTPAGALTAAKVSGSATTLVAAGGYGPFSAEPTGKTEIFRWHIHPQTGLLWQGTPYMDEILVTAAGRYCSANHVTQPIAVNVDYYFVFEE